jgi:alpha-mannosidase
LDCPQTEVSALDLERQPTLFLVYTVHLDTQWRWTIRDTIRKFLPATFEGNFALFEKHPERVLSFEGAFRYRLIEEYYPEAFARLADWVARGNWRLAGTMLDSPDVNCVAPESLLRHILYARRYFEEAFGTTSRDVFLPDCFGFGHALPTLAAHCGLLGFSSQKFGNWGSPAELPFDLGRWLGPDGQGLVAALRPEGYGEGLHEDLSQAERWQRRIAHQREISGLAVALMYVGLGDRGGRLGDQSLDWIERSVAGDGPIRVLQTASDTLARTLDCEQVERLPTHQGELLLPTHGTGCWTSQAAAKRWNRACELTADAAERAAVIASWLGLMSYPADALRRAWERFLWHQMHDDLTGTSIPEAYRFTWNDQLIAANVFETVLADAARAVGGSLDSSGAGRPLMVFNPLPRRRCDLLEAVVDWPQAPRALEARGPAGEVVPVQVVDREPKRLRVVFAPPLPPLGFSIWRLVPASDLEPPTDLEATLERIANAHFELAIEDGRLASLVDRASGEELLAAPLALELLPDRSRRWPAWEIHERDVRATPVAVGGRAKVTVRERGPVRAVVEISRRFAGSTYHQRLVLGCGDAGRRIDVEHTIDWRTRGRLLKLALRQPTAAPAAIYGLGCGTIERGLNSEAKYEVPGLWAAAKEGGLAIIAERHSGWDRPDPSTLRLSLLRSPRVGRKFRHQGVQDLGTHELRCTLARHVDVEGSEEHAAAFAGPPRAWQLAGRKGELGRAVSLLAVEPGAVVRALKRPETGSGLVLRLQESGGRRRSALVVAASGRLRSAQRLDGCEERLAAEETAGSRTTLDLEPYALRTLRLDIAPPPVRDAAAFRALDLPFDLRATSWANERRSSAGSDLDSYLPAELWPTRIQAGSVPFELAAASGETALRCRRQEISWEGEAQRLWLLAATVDHPRKARFYVGRRPVMLEIDAWGGFIGCFKGLRRGVRHRRWGRPGSGFLRQHTIGWVATHRHDPAGADLAYDFGYLFRYVIELLPGDSSVTLPESPQLLVFAATLESRPRPTGWRDLG